MLGDFGPRGMERFESNRARFKIQVGICHKTTGLHDTPPLRIAVTPPGYSSGLVSIFREPQAEHFAYFGHRRFRGKWHRRGIDAAVVAAIAAVTPQQFSLRNEVTSEAFGE
jgi:hypothetical protein